MTDPEPRHDERVRGILDTLGRLSQTLAVAESCTGGGLGASITTVPGSSDVFVGGVIAYANSVKVGLLGVSPAELETRGAVTRDTAECDWRRLGYRNHRNRRTGRRRRGQARRHRVDWNFRAGTTVCAMRAVPVLRRSGRDSIVLGMGSARPAVSNRR